MKKKETEKINELMATQSKKKNLIFFVMVRFDYYTCVMNAIPMYLKIVVEPLFEAHLKLLNFTVYV